MRLWIHITAATILTVCGFTHGRVTVNPFNDNNSKSKENESTSSEDQAIYDRSPNAEEFYGNVPDDYKKHFEVRYRKVAFQPKEPRCMKALKWLEETHKTNLTMIQKLIIYNIVSCPEKTKHDSKAYCARNEKGHTRYFSNKCLQCAKGCKDVLNGGTRYKSRTLSDCKTAEKQCKKLSCPDNATCVFNESRYRCVCPAGYEGPNCDVDIDECASSPCQNEATCLNKVNGYNCNCVPGYDGITCDVDIDECASSPCQHESQCLNGINGYKCNCVPGYEGINCEIDIDECASSPCQHEGQCLNGINGYKCDCVSGYKGINCEVDIDECASTPCQNNATCLNEVNGYECQCVSGYEGVNCELETDECLSSPCLNGATCLDYFNGYECNCTLGFQGTNCDIDINECSSSPCQNEGTCIDKVNGYVCNCTTAFQGVHCDFETITTVMEAPEITHCVRTLQNGTDPRINCPICGPSEPLEDYRSKTIPVLPTFLAKNWT